MNMDVFMIKTRKSKVLYPMTVGFGKALKINIAMGMQS